MPDPAFDVGFQSLETELDRRDLPVEGEIPGWLSGSLIRNGPGRFEAGDRELRHWFDGLAMLRKYDFEDGHVRYSNRFLRTESYADATVGRATGQFATGKRGLGKLRSWIGNLGPPKPTDNANVNVVEIDEQLVAQTEVPRWIGFDHDSLETGGEFEFDDTLDVHMTSAHLVREPQTDELFGHALSFGRTHEYRLFRIPPGTRRREQITSIPTDKPAYIHSIGVSKRHLVLVETPLRIDILRGLSPFREGFFDLLAWEPDRDTHIYVVDRETGETVTEARTAPFFTFHTINAFDDGEAVVVDLVAFEDDAIVAGLSFDVLRQDGFDGVPPGRFVRLRVGNDGTVAARRLYDGGLELPTVAPAVRTRPYRYAYAQSTDRAGANGLVKIDTRGETAREWWERGLYVEEPCVVEHPAGDDEDDAVVLAPALDVDAERSLLLVFDAETLAELGRVLVPHAEPFAFHGQFFEM